MAKITNYDELLDLIKSLKKGDYISISPDDVSPYLIETIADLSLAPVTLSFEEKSGDSTIKGKGKLFDMDDISITMTFGPKDPDDAKGPFLLKSLGSSLPNGTEWKLIDGFKIFAMEFIFELNLELKIYSASIGCKLLIGGESGLAVDIQMLIPPSATDWMIIGEFDATPLNQNSFNALAGKMDIKEFLPEKLCILEKFSVRSIELAFNPSAGIFSYLYFVVEYNDEWSLLDDIIKVKKGDIKLNFMVYLHDFDNTYIELDSILCIESVNINLGAHFAKNNSYVWGKLADGCIISITKLLTHFKINIPKGLPEIDIIKLGLLADISNKSLELDLESRIDAGKDFKISSLRANLNVDINKRETKGDFAATISIEETTHLFISAKYEGEDNGLKFEGEAENIEIGALITYLGEKFKITDMPKSLERLAIKKLKTSYDTASGDFTFAISGDIPVAEANLIIEMNISAIHQNKDKYIKKLDGTLALGPAIFNLDFTKDGKSTEIIASWKLKGGQTLGLKEIASALGLTPPDIPEELNFGLDAASFAYDTSEHTFVLIASSKLGRATFAARKDKSGWQLFLGVAIGQSVCLSNMPLIKSIVTHVSPDEVVEIRDIQVLIALKDLEKTAATDINNVIDAAIALINKSGIYFNKTECIPENADSTEYPIVIKEGMQKGIVLSMIFKAGTFQTPFFLSLSGKPTLKDGKYPPAAPAALLQDPSRLGAATASDGTVWYNLQKAFGPISFQKVGIRYKNSILYVLINASLGAGGLNITVLGLGVGSPLKEFTPRFNIDGIAITFKEGPVDISGGLIGTLNPIDFYGELVIGFPGWNISALGGYAEVANHPSFFLYAVLNRPIGGPSFFFVTGLAAGFGFNRKLAIPDVSQVASFPLVQWAMGSNDAPKMIPDADIGTKVREALMKLSASGVVAPSAGDYWLALGIRFTSFKLLESFILLTVSFGTSFEINLLGISRLSIPPQTQHPVANVELALKASFSPGRGIISVLGQLTPNSYLLSKDCHLTGGFAVCAWFKDQHAGDFIITLGGYSPRFVPPAHYPQVPRLGFSWNVTSNLSIKGYLYFALTPKAVMAGGGLSAVWASGCVKAWFDLQADFLMVYQPFQYYLSASVHFGGSVRLNLLFTTVTLTINLGARLEIWGPEFSGRAEIDLGIFSFSISFGSGKLNEPTVSWDEFKKGLMPSAASPAVSRSRNMRSALCRKTNDSDNQPSAVHILISGGLQKTISEKDGELNYVVSAERFELTTQTVIPAKEPDIKPFSENLTPAKQQPELDPNINFGVGPTGTDNNSFSSIHSISIKAMSGQNSRFLATRLLGNVPKALWEKKTFDHGVPVGTDPLNDTTIKNVLVGYKIVPEVLVPEKTLPINQEQLLHTVDRYQFEWSPACYPRGDVFTNEAVLSTIGSSSAKNSRESFLKAMFKEGLNKPKEIDVKDLEDPSRYYLTASPGLSLLGEQRRQKV